MDVDAIIDVLSAYFPQTVINVFAFALTSLLALVPDSTHLRDPQSWVPLALSLLAIYFTIASVYRTVSFGFRAAVFFVKYGALLGVAAALYGYISDPANGPRARPRAPAARRAGTRGGGTKRPGPLDTFEKHAEFKREWHASKRVELDAEEGRKVVEGVMNQVWNTVQRWAVSGFLNIRSVDDTRDADRKRKGTNTKSKGTRSR